jgi:hypothetical protein
MTTTGSTNSQPTAHSRKYKAPKENAHMSVLGMDGKDLEVSGGSSSTTSLNDNAGTVTTKPSEGSSTNVDSSTQGEGSTTNNDNSPVQADLPGSRTSWWGNVWGGTYAPVAPQSTAPRFTPDSLMPSESVYSNGLETPTVEDQLRQDCSFFYQGLEDQPTPDKRRRLRPFSSNKTRAIRNGGRDGANFHAKYQQLNQENEEKFGRHHDLLLEEEGPGDQPVRFSSDYSINVLDTQHSSLFYQQDGRTLMRLPRDQMRLMMDHDLEPGIISVEQWRHADKAYSGSQVETNPPLKYVLTVPDDLYRRVVSEMSYRLIPPWWGFFKCCHYHDDAERADIRLALLILSVILTLIFVFTMEWRTE